MSSIAGELRGGLNEVDSAVRDLLNLVLNVTHDGTSSASNQAAKQAAASPMLSKGSLPLPGALAQNQGGPSGARGDHGSVPHFAANAAAGAAALQRGGGGMGQGNSRNGPRADGYEGNSSEDKIPILARENRATEIADQQKQLIDSILATCKVLQARFSQLEEGPESASAVQAEIKALEAEIAEKDTLMAEITRDLEQWASPASGKDLQGSN